MPTMPFRMIQTADGALAVIDEKLIRLKELAEQAATGTYDSTQRLIIDSEFQQMTSEIDRIAKSTDFNGCKILCDDTANKMEIGGCGGKVLPPAGEITDAYSFNPLGDWFEVLNPHAIIDDAFIHIRSDIATIAGYTGDPNVLMLWLAIRATHRATPFLTLHTDMIPQIPRLPGNLLLRLGGRWCTRFTAVEP